MYGLFPNYKFVNVDQYFKTLLNYVNYITFCNLFNILLEYTYKTIIIVQKQFSILNITEKKYTLRILFNVFGVSNKRKLNVNSCKIFFRTILFKNFISINNKYPK